MQLTIKSRLMLGFGIMLLLLAVVAGVGQIQLAKIQHFNTELDERAFRLNGLLGQTQELSFPSLTNAHEFARGCRHKPAGLQSIA